MKIMGLKGGMLWVSWYVKQFLFMLIPTVLLAILLKVCYNSIKLFLYIYTCTSGLEQILSFTSPGQ